MNNNQDNIQKRKAPAVTNILSDITLNKKVTYTVYCFI